MQQYKDEGYEHFYSMALGRDEVSTVQLCESPGS